MCARTHGSQPKASINQLIDSSGPPFGMALDTTVILFTPHVAGPRGLAAAKPQMPQKGINSTASLLRSGFSAGPGCANRAWQRSTAMNLSLSIGTLWSETFASCPGLQRGTCVLGTEHRSRTGATNKYCYLPDPKGTRTASNDAS